MKRLRIIVIVLTALVIWWIYYSYKESTERKLLLISIKNHHLIAEGKLEHLPVAHGSGPKKSPDFGYTYEVNGEKLKGYIRTSGAFRIPLGVHSINDLKSRPMHGENITVFYNPNNPKESTPFEVEERHFTYIKWVMWICIGFGVIIYTALLSVIRVLNKPLI